jgi:hypothetical protein
MKNVNSMRDLEFNAVEIIDNNWIRKRRRNFESDKKI